VPLCFQFQFSIYWILNEQQTKLGNCGTFATIFHTNYALTHHTKFELFTKSLGEKPATRLWWWPHAIHTWGTRLRVQSDCRHCQCQIWALLLHQSHVSHLFPWESCSISVVGPLSLRHKQSHRVLFESASRSTFSALISKHLLARLTDLFLARLRNCLTHNSPLSSTGYMDHQHNDQKKQRGTKREVHRLKENDSWSLTHESCREVSMLKTSIQGSKIRKWWLYIISDGNRKYV
jgi:hypothetical protein